MRKFLIVLITALIVAGAGGPAIVAGDVATAQTQTHPSCEYPVELTDATGETIELEESPDRVVALQPSDAQTLFSIGAEETLVGMPINEYTSSLEAGDRTNVGVDGEMGINVEAVVDLEPDVVLAANATLDGDVQQLRESGVTVYQFHTAGSIEDVRENVRVAGTLTDTCQGATETVEWMDDRLEIVETAIEGEDRPLVYYEMGEGSTPGANTFQTEVMATAGLENLGERVGIDGWGEVNAETVVDEDPEWILYPNWADEPPVAEAIYETTAYRDENFVVADSNNMSQPAPGVVYAIEHLTQAVHPDAFEAAQDEFEAIENESQTNNESQNDSQNDAEDGDDGDDGDDDSVPGFGVPVAVAVVFGTLGFGRRFRART